MIFAYLFRPIYEHFNNNITFSSSDKWGTLEKKLVTDITPVGIMILKSLPRIQFPDNSSVETKLELQDIHKKQISVSKTRIRDINNQIYLISMLDKLSVTRNDRIIIKDLLKREIDPIIMALKKEYNRARPYRLDETIIPIIDPPKHPSYPSGHSTQAYFIGLLLSEKYPGKKTHYMSVASEIAVNREYAGVHYSSDTLYGKIIANHLFQHFSNTNNPLLDFASGD